MYKEGRGYWFDCFYKSHYSTREMSTYDLIIERVSTSPIQNQSNETHWDANHLNIHYFDTELVFCLACLNQYFIKFKKKKAFRFIM